MAALEGHVGDLDLAGVRFLATFEMGKWSRLYIDDSLSAAQNDAVDAILPLAFAFFFNGARSIERVPMTVTRTSRRSSPPTTSLHLTYRR